VRSIVTALMLDTVDTRDIHKWNRPTAVRLRVDGMRVQGQDAALLHIISLLLLLLLLLTLLVAWLSNASSIT